MSALDVVYRVRAAGGHIRIEGDTLRLQAPEPLPDELVQEVKEHKPELLKLLKRVSLFAPRRVTRPAGTTVGDVQLVQVLNYSREHAEQDGMAVCTWCVRCKRNGGTCRKADLEDKPHRCPEFQATEPED